ncbi:uncharacterized protein LOC119094913 [Pollicipes pollicipes]|uniref:uncharacterized protein LOC119094913 n=1 Tax=Pollicipes pollicipes TaxID=41117 RepID=UPI00188560FB|nr:uncharacterized protein LOC119094913 [Pollicipes pollicipes]
MASTTSSQYRHQERSVTGRPGRPENWDQQLDTLLSDLNESTGPGQGGGPPARGGAPVQGGALPGSEDFHERCEYTSPDQRTRTVEERSQRTARAGDGRQMVARQMYKSSHSSSTGQLAVLPPGPAFDTTPTKENGVDMDSLLDQIDVSNNTTASNAAPRPHSKGRSPGLPDEPSLLVPDISQPAPAGHMRVTKYQYRSSKQRSVSPQPAPAAPHPDLTPRDIRDVLSKPWPAVQPRPTPREPELTHMTV